MAAYKGSHKHVHVGWYSNYKGGPATGMMKVDKCMKSYSNSSGVLPPPKGMGNGKGSKGVSRFDGEVFDSDLAATNYALPMI